MSLTETSKTVASAKIVVVDGFVTGFPLSAPDGSGSAPSFSFSADPGSGLYMTPAGDMTMSVSGSDSWSTSPGPNVTLAGGPPLSYGGGVGVTHIPQVVSIPSTAPNAGSGGLLYVSSDSLFFKNSLGVATNITDLAGDLFGPGSSVNERAALFNGTTGKIIKDSSLFLDEANSSVLTPAGTAGAPSFSFGSDPSTGMYNLAPDQLGFSTEGVLRLGVHSEVQFTTPLHLATTGGLRISDGHMYAVGDTVVIANDGLPTLAVSPGPNVALGGGVPVNYASGVGVTLLHEVTQAPSGASTGGISVYIDGDAVKGMTTSGTVIDFTSCVEGPVSSTDNALARFSGVDGDLLKDSNVLVADTGEVTASSGSATLPTYSFNSDSSTGMYQVGADSVGFSTEGVNRLTLDTSGKATSSVRALATNGTAGAPGLSFTSDTNTGVYSDGSHVIFSSGGVASAAVSPDLNVSIMGSPASSYGDGSGVLFLNQAITDPTTNQPGAGLLYVPSGDVEMLRFRAKSGTLTDINGKLIGPIVADDRAVARWDGTSGGFIQNSNVTVTAAGGILGVDGSASAVSYGFTGDTNTGMFLSGTSLGVSVDGSEKLTVGSGGVTSSQPVDVPSGLVGAPSIRFTSDTDTGLYHPSADTVSFVGGGSAGLAVTLISGGAATNVTLCSDTLGYGLTTEGEGLVKIDDASVAPSGVSTGGGRLYVSGTSLIFHDNLGNHKDLLNSVSGPGSSTLNSVLTWDGTSGAVVQDSTLTVSGSSVVHSTGVVGAPTFSFTSIPTVGVYFPSTSSISMASGGVNSLVVTSTEVSSPVRVSSLGGVEVGGSTGVHHFVTGSVNIKSDIQSASGSMEWTNDAGTIMSTSGLDLSVVNNMVFTEGTETFTIGSGYVFNSAGATPKDVAFDVGGGRLLSFGTGTEVVSQVDVTTTGRFVATASGSQYQYIATSSTNRGLIKATNSIEFGLGALPALTFNTNNNTVLGRGVEPFHASAEGVFYVEKVSSIGTTGANSLSLYSQVDEGVYGLGGQTSGGDTTLFDAGRVRAVVTLTTSVTTTTSTNTDGLTWVVVDNNGVGGTTTGRMITPENCFVGFTASAEWASNSTGYRRLSIMRRTAGPTYTELNSVTTTAVNGDVTSQTVYFFGSVASSTDELTVQVEQTSGGNLSVDLRASFVRYTTNE